MKIVILGAGAVGGALAKLLALEENDVLVVDRDANSLNKLEEDADIKTILGGSSYPNKIE